MYQYEPTPQDLNDLREWLNKVPYLPHNLADHFLATFYRSCKGSLEKTKQRIDAFCMSRIKCPHLTTKLDVFAPALQQNLNIHPFTLMPNKTPDGGIVVFGCLKSPDPDDYVFVQTCRNLLVTAKTMMEDDACGSSRITVIIDIKPLGARHLLKIHPNDMVAGLNVLMASPFRFNGFHMLNTPPGIEWLVDLAKSILKVKLAQRIHLHTNQDGVFKWLPKDVLPMEYGGEGGSFEKISAEFRKKIESYAKKYLEEETELAKLDLLRPQISDDMHLGSFRKLEVD